MNDIIKRKETLPDTIEDLSRFIMIGKEQLKAYEARLKAVGHAGFAKDVRDQKLGECQDMATALLSAEARLGDLLEEIPKKYTISSVGGTNRPQREPSLPPGITKKQSHYAQEISRNRDLIQETIDRAIEKDEIPRRTDVLKAIHKKKRDAAETPELPEGKYRILYADPPWKYGDELIEGYGAAEHHYPTMAIPELCALPIRDLSDENSVLFLWVTSPLLHECFSVIEAWGFEYKTSFIWDKIQHNYGHYNSVRHELLLICTRGSCLPDSKELHDSVVSIKREKHSMKPEYFREKIIDAMYPKGKRIELFARGEIPKHWDPWGNE